MTAIVICEKNKPGQSLFRCDQTGTVLLPIGKLGQSLFMPPVHNESNCQPRKKAKPGQSMFRFLPCRDDFAERYSRFDGTLINGTLINGTLINGTLINGTLINGTLINGTLINGTLINGTLKIDYPKTAFPQCLLFWLRSPVVNECKSPQDLVQTRTVLVPLRPNRDSPSSHWQTGTVLVPASSAQ
jgi:hypothetical protein